MNLPYSYVSFPYIMLKLLRRIYFISSLNSGGYFQRMENTETKTHSKQPTVLNELLHLLLKIGIAVLIFWIVFSFVFGVFRVQSNEMKPSLQDGDLVLFYRLDKDIQVSEVAVYEYEGAVHAARVIAREGDVVDIDENGLLINGSYQQESNIYTDTQQFAEGIRFPVTVGKDEVFLLGDNRSSASDSRIYGCVSKSSILGTAVSFFRRRGI